MERSEQPSAERARTSCTVLVVGTDDWAIEQAASSLEGAGLAVERCHRPGEPAFPCNALIPGRVCPLDTGFDVVLAARVRAARDIQPGEIGVLCALRTERRLVVAGVVGGSPFEEVATATVAEGGDVAEACRSVAGATRPARERGEGIIDLRPVRH